MGKKIKNFFTKKRIIIISIIVLLILAIVISTVVRNIQSPHDFTNTYDFYKSNYINDNPQNVSVTVTETDMDVTTGLKQVVNAQTSGYEKGNSVKITYNDTLFFKVNMTTAGNYFMSLDYYIATESKNDHSIDIKINGQNQSKEFTSVPLPIGWKNEEDEFSKDSLGNDVLPMQVSIDKFMSVLVNDYQNKEEIALPINFNQGENLIEITPTIGELYIGNVTIFSIENISSYENYKSSNLNKNSNGKQDKSVIIEAEKPTSKNSISILPSNNRSVNVAPYNTYSALLNSITTSKSGQSIVYEFEAPYSGFYKIGLNLHNDTANTTVFRKIAIDGKVPFGELLHYPLKYTSKVSFETLNRDGEIFKFYLMQGKHTLSIDVDGTIMALINEPIRDISAEFSQIYLNLKKLVGVNPDKNRDWDVFEYFPTIVDDFNSYIAVIENSIQNIYKYNGNNAKTQSIVYFETAKRVIQKLLKEPNKIPNNIGLISEGTSSVVQSLALAIADVEKSTLILDRIFITDYDSSHSIKYKSGIYSFWQQVKYFFHTFFTDYSNKKGSDTIEIWVNRSLQNTSLIQKMADADFTSKTGIKVNLSMMKDEGKLILANASGINPDGVIGISNFLPYELGLRDLIYPINELDGFKELLQCFSPGAMLPLIENGRVLGVPETQDATLLFYRTDIFEKLNLKIPDTWEDVKEIMPTLQRNGMNFYLPTSSTTASKSLATTAPFIYQSGGSLYASDGMSTAIDSNEAIEGIRTLTDLYNIYGLPQQVANFMESFRDGTIPIGLGSLAMYAQLMVSAPELVGLWDVAVSPGVEDSSGVVQRWQGGAATSCVILNKSSKPKQVWEFIKWWLSTEVQTNYAQQCRAIWGNEFLWASANKNAFSESATFDYKHRVTILEQWDWVLEVPRIPGWYMIERELSNAWSQIVVDKRNVRNAIDSAVSSSNKEIKRKLTEFGYLHNGKVIKEYKITTLEDVENWIK